MLKNRFVEDDTIIGSIRFAQSKYLSWILSDLEKLSDSIISKSVEKSIINSNDLISNLFSHVYYPVIKYYQTQLVSICKDVSSDNRSIADNGRGFRRGSYRPVETRKIYDKFIKFIKISSAFYKNLLQTLYEHYGVKDVQQSALQVLGELPTSQRDGDDLVINDTTLIARVVYVFHKSYIALGDFSRYRTSIALKCLPPNSRSNADNYNKSIKMYKLAISVCPAIGEPFNHLGMISSYNNELFTSIYYFVRGMTVRVDNQLATTNLIDRFQRKKGLEEFQVVRVKRGTNLKSVSELELALICLIGYFAFPDNWKGKENTLYNGIPLKSIQLTLFKSLGKINSEESSDKLKLFYLHSVTTIIGLHSLLMEKDITATDSDDQASDSHHSPYIKNFTRFAFEYLSRIFNAFNSAFKLSGNLEQVSNFLPVIRLILNWLADRNRKACLQYARRNWEFGSELAEVINNLAGIFGANERHRPVREYFFKEDIELNEFFPIGYSFKDFKDTSIYDAPDLIYRLRGIYDNKLNSEQEDCLRAKAIIAQGRRIMDSNGLKILWKSGLYELPAVGKSRSSKSISSIASGSNEKINNKKSIASSENISQGKISLPVDHIETNKSNVSIKSQPLPSNNTHYPDTLYSLPQDPTTGKGLTEEINLNKMVTQIVTGNGDSDEDICVKKKYSLSGGSSKVQQSIELMPTMNSSSAWSPPRPSISSPSAVIDATNSLKDALGLTVGSSTSSALNTEVENVVDTPVVNSDPIAQMDVVQFSQNPSVNEGFPNSRDDTNIGVSLASMNQYPANTSSNAANLYGYSSETNGTNQPTMTAEEQQQWEQYVIQYYQWMNACYQQAQSQTQQQSQIQVSSQDILQNQPQFSNVNYQQETFTSPIPSNTSVINNYYNSTPNMNAYSQFSNNISNNSATNVAGSFSPFGENYQVQPSLSEQQTTSAARESQEWTSNNITFGNSALNYQSRTQ